MRDFSLDVSESVRYGGHRPVPPGAGAGGFLGTLVRTLPYLKPLLEKLAVEYGGRFVLAKINSDEAQAVAARYAVRSIPAVKLFVNGEVVDEFAGALPEGQVRAFLDGHLPDEAERLRLSAEGIADPLRGPSGCVRQQACPVAGSPLSWNWWARSSMPASWRMPQRAETRPRIGTRPGDH
jgi:hypothetical protein